MFRLDQVLAFILLAGACLLPALVIPMPTNAADQAECYDEQASAEATINACGLIIYMEGLGGPISRNDLAAAYNNRALAYEDNDKTDLALADYNKAIELNPNVADFYINRGKAFFWKTENEKAVADLTRAIELDGKAPAAYFWRGMAHGAKNDAAHDKAISDFTTAIKLKPELAMAYRYRALAYEDKEKTDLALADYNKAIEHDPDYGAAYVNRGKLFLDGDEFDKAIADYSKAIKLDDQNYDAYLGRGEANAEQEQYEMAIADFTSAIKINPKETSPYFQRGMAFNDKDKSEYDKAIADFSKVIEIDQEFWLAYYGRANSYSAKGDYQTAISEYTSLIQKIPDSAFVFEGRGDAYRGKGEYEKAISDYTKAIQLDPDDTDYLFSRAYAYRDLKDFEKAKADMDKVIDLNAKDDVAYYVRARSHLDMGEFDKAIADYSNAIEIDSGDADYFHERAWTYLKAGRASAGLGDANKALELNSDFADAYSTRGLIYVKLERNGEAIADLRKALSLDPSNKAGREGLKLLGVAIVDKKDESSEAKVVLPKKAGQEEKQAPASNSGAILSKKMELSFWESVKDSDDPAMLQAYLDQYPLGEFAALAKIKFGKIQKSKEPESVNPVTKAKNDLSYWNTVKDTNDPAELQTYLDKYPKGEFAALAKIRLSKLKVRSGERKETPKAKPKQKKAVEPVLLPQLTGRDLVIALQTELKRVGCDPGTVDGQWGRKGRAALARFNAQAKAALPADQPTMQAIEAIRAKAGRVCLASENSTALLSTHHGWKPDLNGRWVCTGNGCKGVGTYTKISKNKYNWNFVWNCSGTKVRHTGVTTVVKKGANYIVARHRDSGGGPSTTFKTTFSNQGDKIINPGSAGSCKRTPSR